MTRPGEAEAVEKAVLHSGRWTTHISTGLVSLTLCPEVIAADVVASAYPVIAAAVREVAQEIEARRRSRMSSALSPTPYQDGYCDGWNGAIDAAARIVRGSS